MSHPGRGRGRRPSGSDVSPGPGRGRARGKVIRGSASVSQTGSVGKTVTSTLSHPTEENSLERRPQHQTVEDTNSCRGAKGGSAVTSTLSSIHTMCETLEKSNKVDGAIAVSDLEQSWIQDDIAGTVYWVKQYADQSIMGNSTALRFLGSL